MMKMFYAAIPITLVLCLCLMVLSPKNENVAADTDESVAIEIKALVIENLRATGAEDIEAVLDTMHTQSPAYSNTKRALISVSETYDLKYQMQLFRYIGQDDPYAIARFEFSAEKIAGPAFNDNILDTFHIFRKEDGKWKIWSMAVLDTNLIE